MLNLVSRHGRPFPGHTSSFVDTRLRGGIQPARARLITALCLSALALTGCTHRKLQQSSPQALYTRATQDLHNYNYNAAIKTYEQLTAICDRVFIFNRGRVVKELVGAQINKSAIAEACYKIH